MSEDSGSRQRDGGTAHDTGPRGLRRRRSWWSLGIPLGAVIAFALGGFAVVAFIASVEASSSESFCMSCHEMRETVVAEFRQSVHYSNRTGVHATCADCHVPHAWGPKIVTKIKATLRDVPNRFLGTIDTPEKFRAHRQRMAEDVWREMRSTDSRECRSCHDQTRMKLELQDRSARRKHTAGYMQKHGKTCIDCHQGVAHTLPEDDPPPAADGKDTASSAES